MLYPPTVNDIGSTTAVRPTFDALLAGPGDQDADAGDEAPATPYVWRTRAWLPPTKHRRTAEVPAGVSPPAPC